MTNKLKITELVLRDGHQSLFATRMRIDDMLPIAEKLDAIGFWSIETWGGATFDSCIRYLGEDPWDRIRQLKQAMPNTPQQMLLRSQNLLGYRHYADDVVDKFVERSAINGVDVFRVFDAMNDVRNMRQSLQAVINNGKHAQAAISYTLSPVHNIDGWVDLGRKLEDLGAHSLCIKDMAGLLKPYTGYELVKQLKSAIDIPIQLHAHATTGLSTATIVKCVEAGIDMVDTSISSMAMTYGHSPTESIVAIMQETERDTGLAIEPLEDIAAYFREVRKKYSQFEGSLKGVDSRILLAQVPGGMLTNMESQLTEQRAAGKFDEVLAEIPRVREDLGFIPLVTPTSQIVGTQSVLNVLTGERYKNMSKETAGVLKGEYGATPAPVNKELQQRVLDGNEIITCRPADLIEPEMDRLSDELKEVAAYKSIKLAKSEGEIDDVLIYALFPQIGLRYLENRGNPDAFEPAPSLEAAGVVTDEAGDEVYTVELDDKSYIVKVTNGGVIAAIVPTSSAAPASAPTSKAAGVDEIVPAPLAGNVFRIEVTVGQQISEGDTIIILEAMKMETSISAPRSGTVATIEVLEGSSVAVGDNLLTIV
ncbi:MAG: sodium-extruding oxaloacetate decarboxylase subunit alpha [Proteobacteria bacterium]|jgi:oxaloacetate decarboxylase (Na+ extruding) subunit alpha|nr:sodium-extruding oxaloacetate decarboxylase subunit alpha [Pseudomonadota bacterium]